MQLSNKSNAMNQDLHDYQALIEHIIGQQKFTADQGKIASYIPELSKVEANKCGMHLVTNRQRHYSAGDSNEKFSIQSVAKVLSLILAFKAQGNALWSRVGVEPSGTAFNSMVQLEYEQGIPRNPFINAGALVICDVLVSYYQDPKQEMLDFVRGLCGVKNIVFNEQVVRSEKQSGYQNIALVNLMRAFGNIHNEIEKVLDLYFHLCAIEMTCQELAVAFLFLAANGINPLTQQQVLDRSQTKRINAIMQLCGFYDEAGEFSFKVGLPGKSGVGGGIIAIHPEKYSVAVWSPKLNAKGNSLKGMKMLEQLTSATQLSIF